MAKIRIKEAAAQVRDTIRGGETGQGAGTAFTGREMPGLPRAVTATGAAVKTT